VVDQRCGFEIDAAPLSAYTLFMASQGFSCQLAENLGAYSAKIAVGDRPQP